MGSKIKAPAPRSYMGEMQSALSAQGGIQSQLLGLEAQYTPQWQQLQQQNLMGAMGNINALYGQAIPQSETLQNQMLASQGRVYSGVGEQARNAYNATLDPTTAGLYSTMASQAAGGLASGRNLSDQEMRMGQGSARAAMAARGMQFGNQAIAAEVLNSYNLSNAREDRARKFAGDVYGIGQNNAQQAMSMYGQPLMQQMSAVSASGMLGQAGTYNSGLGAKLFQPESQYNAGLISANRQEEMQAQIANQQAKAGMISAGIGALGMMGGGLLGNAGLFAGKVATTAGGSLASGLSTAQSTYGGLLGSRSGTPYSGYSPRG
jgi:hypothetical protein